MVQWFKKKTIHDRVLGFNKDKLQSEINNLSDKLYEFRNEMSLKIILEVLEMARNIQILDVNLYKDEKSLLIHKGRLQALGDMISYLGKASTTQPNKKEDQPRGAVKLVNQRRVQEDLGI